MHSPGRVRTIQERRRFMRRAVEIGVVAAAVVLHARAGYGAPVKDVGHSCVAAYKSAVKAEQASHLREAQKSFASCARAVCGALVRRECLLRYDQLASDIPSVVPVVTDVTGDPILDVKVTMDGEVLTTKIDGRAVPVDPGLHEFGFSTGTGSSTQKIVILQGQRNRPIAINLGLPGSGQKNAQRVAVAAPVAAPSAVEPEAVVAGEAASARQRSLDVADEPGSVRRRSGGRSVAPYIATGIGLAGLGSYALLTYWGRKDNDMLVKCKPDCLQTSVDHVHRLYLAANISLGVGVAALGAATWLFLRSGSKTEQASSGSRVALDVVPLPAGALASVRGGF
jgi:hypothetical protein